MKAIPCCVVCGSGDMMYLRFLSLLVGVALALPSFTPIDAATIEPIAYRVPARLPDVLQQLSPGDIELRGWLGKESRTAFGDLGPLRRRGGDGRRVSSLARSAGDRSSEERLSRCLLFRRFRFDHADHFAPREPGAQPLAGL